MTADRLALALSRLHVTIMASQAAPVLEPLRASAAGSKPDVQALLQVFATLSSGQTQFGEAERELLAAFGLGAIVDTAWWAALITACSRSTMTEQSAAMIDTIHARLQVATDTFPALARLLEEPGAAEGLDLGGVVLLLPGVDGAPPVLGRVAAAIEAVNQLWTVAEDLTGQPGALRLTGMDAGPTLTMHFDGLAEPMMELRSLLDSIWEQLARLVSIPVEQHPSLVPEMLPVMQRIGQSSRPDALRVRTAVEAGVRRLLETGCVLPPARRTDDLANTGTGAGSASAPDLSSAPWGMAPVADEAAESDVSHLAEVIAQERSQLKRGEPARRLWQGATTAGSA